MANESICCHSEAALEAPPIERRFPMLKIQLVISMLLAVAFLPQTLAAQNSNDSGQYVILSAQYGTARHRTDKNVWESGLSLIVLNL
jgi:hypothetical protein